MLTNFNMLAQDNVYRKWFNSFGIIPVADFGFSPITYPSSASSPDYFVYSDYFTFVSGQFNMRYNFYEVNRNFSFSLSSPINVGASMWGNMGDYSGFGHMNLPLMVGINGYMHSTNRNISAYGFSISVGPSLMIGPFVGGYYDLNNVDVKVKRIGSGLAYRFALKHPFKGQNRYVSMCFSPGQKVVETSGETYFKNLFISFSVGYLLKYQDK